MSNINYLEPVSFLYRLKHPHLNENVDPENFRHFLGLCEIEFEDSQEGCVNYIFEKKYNVRPFAQPTKIEHLIEVLKNLQKANFCIIQENEAYYYSKENKFHGEEAIVIYGTHAYLVKRIDELIELSPFADLNQKKPIKRVKLDGYKKGDKALCKRCMVKYSPSFFDVGYCSVTCAALGLPINKKCKACETEYLTVKFLDNNYCSLMCRCFPTKEQQAKMELYFDKSREDLLAQYRNDMIDNQEITMMYAAQDFFLRLENGTLTREEIIALHKKVLDKSIDIKLNQPDQYENILPNDLNVFKDKRKRHLGYDRYKVNGNQAIWQDPKEEFVPVYVHRDSEGYYKAYRSEEYLLKYTLNLDPALLKDLKENVMSHEHLCFSCGNTYIHSHKYFNKEHPQFLRQCGNLDCKMYGLKSKPKVIEGSLFDINQSSIFDLHADLNKPIINSLNIVNPKPNFSLNKLNNYNQEYLSKKFKEGFKEHPHPNLAFDRYFLEKWMYTEVITEPHYVMAAAPKRISRYTTDSFYSVPHVVDTDLDRQEELRLVQNKFCYHKLEDCNHLKDFEILTGTHTLYYITKENYKYIKHMKYMVFVAHLYFDNLPEEEIETIEFNVKVKMSVKGNSVAYEHNHPLEALRILSQDYNIVVIGSMQYTQVLFLTRKDLSCGQSDFIERYEKGLLLRGVTGNDKDFDMLEYNFDLY